MALKILTTLREKPLPAILILGGLVRVVFLLTYYLGGQWNQLMVDSLFHNYWALSIAEGNVVGQDAFFRAPLYIYLLGGIYAIFGQSILVARIFGHICGLAAVLVTGHIANRLFGKRIAAIAALLHALYPIIIYYESELLVDNLFTLLVELSILFFLMALKSENRRWYLLTGLAIGLAAITRPVILAMLPLFMVWIFYVTRNARKTMIRGLILFVSLVIIILPVTIRNLIVADDPVLISSSGGINFYLGNNATADGYSATMPSPLGHNWQIKDINFQAESEAGRELKASEISNFWYKKGMAWIKQNKADFLRLYLYKLYLCLNNTEISNNRNLGLFFGQNPILQFIPLNYSLILALAVMALAILIIRKKLNSRILFISIFIMVYFLVISLFFINARFRLPIVPLLIIMASCGLSGVAEAIQHKMYHPAYLLPILVGTGIFLFSLGSISRVDSKDITSGLFNQGNYYLSRNALDKATEYFTQLLALNPRHPDANLNLGAVYLKRGMGDSAEAYFLREIEFYPERARGYSNMASLHYLGKKYESALHYAERALSLKPYLTDAILVKMRLQAALNDTAGLQRTIGMSPQSAENGVRINLEAGIIYSGWQMYDSARIYLTSVLRADQIAAETDDGAFSYAGTNGRQLTALNKGRAAYQLGYIFGIQNDLSHSIDMSRLALQYDSTLADAYVNLINGYWMMGKIDSARAVSKIALKKFPEHMPLKSISKMFQ